MSDAPLAETIAFPGARLRPGQPERRVLGLLLVLAIIVVVGPVVVDLFPPVMGFAGALLVAYMAVVLHRRSRPRLRGGGLVEVRGGGLYAEGRLALPRETLEQAVVSREDRGWVVSIYGRLGLAVVDVADEEEGRALVKALALDAMHALSTFVFGGALGVGHVSLSIGLDGVLVCRLLRYEFIHFTDLQAVDHDGTRLLLDVADGSRRVLSAQWVGHGTATGAAGFASKRAYLDAVVARVREALDASRAGGGPVVTALERRDQDLGAWVRSLHGLVRRGAGDFRDPATVPEQLWRTVEDGGALPVTRAAAAIALAPTLDGADRERLRAVARVVVSPRLRIAIEAAAREDDEATLEAMATLDQGASR